MNVSSSPVLSSLLGTLKLTLENTPGRHPDGGCDPVEVAVVSMTVPPSGGVVGLFGGPGPSGSLIAVKGGRKSHSNSSL